MAPSLRFRPANAGDVEDIAAVHVAGWRDNYHGMIDDRIIDERTVEWRIEHWTRAIQETKRLTFVAEDERAVVGFASTLVLKPSVEGFDSYLETLYLRSSEKRRGTGRALLRVTAEALLQRGCKNMALRVLRLNPARAFYERLGAHLLEGGLRIDADAFDDVAYAFDDLRLLL